MSKNRLTAEKRIELAKEYLRGETSYERIAKKYGIGTTPAKEIVAIYESQGEEAFLRKKNQKYSKELKLKAVADYQSGKDSLKTICQKYKITRTSSLRSWIKWYNGHKDFKERSTAKGEIYMTKGRKKDHARRTHRDRCILHRTRQRLRTDSRNIQGIVSTNICVGTQV